MEKKLSGQMQIGGKRAEPRRFPLKINFIMPRCELLLSFYKNVADAFIRIHLCVLWYHL